MGKKSKNDAGLSDEQREFLTTLHGALGAVLGSATPASKSEPAEADEPELGGDDTGLDDLGADDGGLGEEEEAIAVTVDDVRTALKKVLAKHGAKGKDKVAAILSKFGAKTLPDLDEEKFEAAIALCKKHS